MYIMIYILFIDFLSYIYFPVLYKERRKRNDKPNKAAYRKDRGNLNDVFYAIQYEIISYPSFYKRSFPHSSSVSIGYNCVIIFCLGSIGGNSFFFSLLLDILVVCTLYWRPFRLVFTKKKEKEKKNTSWLHTVRKRIC